MFCILCLKDAYDFMHMMGLADGNPFAAAIGLALNPNICLVSTNPDVWGVSPHWDSKRGMSSLPLTGRYSHAYISSQITPTQRGRRQP